MMLLNIFLFGNCELVVVFKYIREIKNIADFYLSWFFFLV